MAIFILFISSGLILTEVIFFAKEKEMAFYDKPNYYV